MDLGKKGVLLPRRLYIRDEHSAPNNPLTGMPYRVIQTT